MKRFALIVECCCVLLLCAAAASLLWTGGPLTLQRAGVALVIPTVSSLLFLCLSMGVPDLYAVDSLRFPLNLTLPVVYLATLLLTMTLISRVGLSITRMPDAFSAFHIWTNWKVLGSTFATGVAFMSILTLFGRRENGPSAAEG